MKEDHNAYDTIGNRTSDTLNGMSRSYAANCLNQYTQIDAAQMAYDADGNLVRDDRFAYAYDAENRMLSARPIAPSEGDLAVVNAYDHKHRRVMKRVERFDGDEWQTSETHAFAYDGSNIVLERIAFADGTTRTVEYFWGNDLSGTEQGAGGVGGLVAVSVDGAFFIPCYDHNGNIVCYVSESGTIAAQYVYAPYGNVIEQYGTLVGKFAIRFSTKYTDVETGLISYLRRFYRPDHGRWLNRDPIEERGGENLYAFGLNNPILKVDAYGLYTLSDAEQSLRLRNIRPTAGLNSIMPFYDDETLFNEWIALERKRGSWWSSLPKCPGRLCLKNGRPVNPDPSKWKNPGRGGQIRSRYHPGGVFEMRSLAVEGHGNQCVYDADGKVLVGPPSGGTVDWAAPGLSYLWGHGPHDVNTYELVERIKRIPDYYSVRPSW